MLDFVDIKDDIEPLVAVVEAFSSATSRADRASLLAQIRGQLEKLRAMDKNLQRELGEFHETPSEGGVGAAEAEQTALVLREDEGAAAKLLPPRILNLQGYLTGISLNDDPEGPSASSESYQHRGGLCRGYQNLRDQLIRRDAARGQPPVKYWGPTPLPAKLTTPN